MFDNFYNDLVLCASNTENTNSDGTVNWNFVDSDMFEKYQVLLDGETYSTYFDKAADIVESAV